MNFTELHHQTKPLLIANVWDAAAGADGLFVPCLTSEKDIEIIAQEINLPLNLMCMPDLPRFEILARIGVRRISMGNFVHSAMQSKLNDLMRIIQSQQSFSGIFVDESSR